MAPLFPAILIGGPAHSGKSTLTYRLSQYLRKQGIAHYALRASPDGDGDWVALSAETVVAELRPRVRSGWSPTFAAAVARDVAARHLPLIVDVGGRVSAETAQIAQHCTHALLISADPAALAPWRALVARYGLVLVAELHSALTGEQIVTEIGPPLHGTIVGLSRASSSEGVCFAALVNHLEALCAYSSEELFQSHMVQTDIELVLHLEQPIYPLPAHTQQHWQPAELPILLPTLPTNTPLAIYGRGPLWLYAALALANPSARCAVFDPRQGWVEVQPLQQRADAQPGPLHISQTQEEGATRLRMSIPSGYLDRRDNDLISIPPLDNAIILDGRLPTWLYAALARTYQTAPWIACYQPQIRGSVVVYSNSTQFPVGLVIPDRESVDQK